jgi:hypothetical protein
MRQAGIILHPEAQRSEHRIKTLAPTKALPRQEPARPIFGNQATSKALSPSTTRVSPSHWHPFILPQHLTRHKNLHSPSGLVGEDHSDSFKMATIWVSVNLLVFI